MCRRTLPPDWRQAARAADFIVGKNPKRGVARHGRETVPEPAPVTTIAAISAAWLEGVRQAAEEQARLPKQFERAEGVRWPLAD